MPLFTRCNISLRCPQNVSVKFQLKIPHSSFIISFWKHIGYVCEGKQLENISYVYIKWQCIKCQQRTVIYSTYTAVYADNMTQTE